MALANGGPAAYAVAKKQAWLGGLAMVPFVVMAGTLAVAVFAR